MIDWSLVAKIAGGGFGSTVLALVILCLAAWIMGLIILKIKAAPKETPEKDK